MPEKYLAPKDIAAVLEIHERTVLRWIRKGRLKAMSSGEGNTTRYLVREADFEKVKKDILPFLKSDARHTKNKKG